MGSTADNVWMGVATTAAIKIIAHHNGTGRTHVTVHCWTASVDCPALTTLAHVRSEQAVNGRHPRNIATAGAVPSRFPSRESKAQY
jgi:hypothetical protein